MPTYFVDFQNNTDRVWTMAVYQTLPNSTGLDSVSWLQASAAKGGNTGVQFDITYNVALANYSQANGRGVYKASQNLPAELGSAWEVVIEAGVQQLKPAGQSNLPQQILITNNSNKAANPGIGMSGSASVYKNNVNGGAAAQFQVTPSYYVGLFNDVKKGEVIASNVIVGPKNIKYPSGETSATVTADLDGSTLVLRIDYGDTVSATLAEIDTRQQ
ncbi:MAG: hypothetical protein JWO56_2787, partial [Acidobacteria bacterium]|nr:hypothetical protein [Acidobacteriota bacterium]